MGNVNSKEAPLIQIVTTHQHINSAMLQRTRRLKTELQRGTRQRTSEQRRQKKASELKKKCGQSPRSLDEKLAGNEHSYRRPKCGDINILMPTGYVMRDQFNIQQLYVLPTLYLCVLYLSENKKGLVPLTA